MPFINDLLDQNAEQNARLAREALEGRSPKPAQIAYSSRFTFDPNEVVELLHRRIAGQRKVIEALGAQLRVVKADLCEAGRPLYVTLFVGDTGVGKTEIVRLLAGAIHGSPDSFCRIDMNTLSQSHYSAAITGAPPGYVGSKEGITLFNEELIAGSYGRPGIVLFDEVEKASSDVARSLMNILDAGKLKLANGNRELDFSNCLIFMTSNLGSKAWMELQRKRNNKRSLQSRVRALFKPITHSREELIDDALHNHFDPEFLNRIDRIELFEPLSNEHMQTIVALELERTNRTLKRKGVEIRLEHSAIELLCRLGFDTEFGARAVRRCFREQVILPLAKALLDTPMPAEASKHSLTKPPHSLFRGCAMGEEIRFTRVQPTHISDSSVSSHNLTSLNSPRETSPASAGQEIKP